MSNIILDLFLFRRRTRTVGI